MKHKKIIVWGAKPDTGHTHSFVHSAYVRAAQYLNVEVYWLDNRDNVPDEFFDDSLVISEQWLVFPNGLSSTSNKLPLRESSTYLIHYLGNKGPVEGNPGADMYLGKVGKLIDHRLSCNWGIDGVEDKNYAYKFEKENYEVIRDGVSYYQKGDNYDCFYAFWATDLLPSEINFEDRFTPFAEPKYAFFGGTIREGGGSAVGEENDGNIQFFEPFIRACKENDIVFAHNCPWRNPISPLQLKQYVLQSYLPIDVRVKDHLANKYVPCRSFKNTSYGQLVITNSKAVYDFFEEDAAYSSDTYELFHIAKEMQDDPKTKDKILRQMVKVKENHTYVSRLIDIMKAVDM